MVDFHTLTPNSVAPELQTFVSSLAILAKQAHPPRYSLLYVRGYLFKIIRIMSDMKTVIREQLRRESIQIAGSYVAYLCCYVVISFSHYDVISSFRSRIRNAKFPPITPNLII